MQFYKQITSSLSVPRILIAALLIVAIKVLSFAFSHYGMAAGLAVSVLPLFLCIVWLTLRTPALSMFGVLVINYYIMGIARHIYNSPIPLGTLVDIALFYSFLTLILQAFLHKIEWQRARTGLTLAATIWLIYCTLELVNPETVSPKGWFAAVRSVALYFFLTVVLTQLMLSRYKYLRYVLAIWSVMTLTAVAKALIQKFIGFNAAENYWLFVEGGSTTHIIHSGVRYFSFYSDAANFSAGMGMAMVVFSIAALYYRNPWMKIYMLLVAAAACYGMLISGTRSALAIPFAGYAAFIVLSRNFRLATAGVFLLIGIFAFLNFTSIGQGNAIIRRMRSAFNVEDASFQVRLANQAKLRELMADKPFGAGLGHGGAKAKAIAPDAPLSQVPTDSWFVMIWVETGVVGILLHVGILLYILGYGTWLVLFRLRNKQLRGFTAALVAGIAGVMTMSYANEVLGQIPNGVIIYMSMAFIFLAPTFDRELTGAEKAKPAIIPDARLLAGQTETAGKFPDLPAKPQA